MGTTWNTYPQTKEQFVRERVAAYSEYNNVLHHSVRGNNLWLLIKSGDNEPIIGLAILYCDKGCWGYKDMAEADSPYRYDCPLAYLKVAPEPEGFNKDHKGSGRTWRDFVRDFHAERRQKPKLKVGDRVTLSIPGYDQQYLVTEALGRKGFILNNFLRLKCTQVKYAQVVGG